MTPSENARLLALEIEVKRLSNICRGFAKEIGKSARERRERENRELEAIEAAEREAIELDRIAVECSDDY